ncbi:Protein RIK [Apostasia shenzhenica]|uniref:Protein RIK n=1 Tax=Apostasia shenzhenica TaxID=1088818 RepID=A0A2I0A2H5_9ASPA|nr:Protein RIK [Apostasia shenzhenica]
MLGPIPIGIGGAHGISVPGAFPLTNAFAASSVLPAAVPNVATISQKLNQTKAQDELIAREIVINDAEPTIRYKLTKRQTQEEIQKCTGAVVITRGKYRPPNALPDNEKPLYLHISAGSHLKDMAERIVAVDRAASMVEEILRQGQNSLPASAFNSNEQVNQPLSICLFLGFEADPSLNISARIRGPNDQYINHIINETGATVLLRGRGSGNEDISHADEAQQPLHLYISSINSKSLEAARSLAENLLDTISTECGASSCNCKFLPSHLQILGRPSGGIKTLLLISDSCFCYRVTSCKVYNAVPPPQQLSAGVESSVNAEAVASPLVSSTCTATGCSQLAQSFASSMSVVSSMSTLCPPGVSTQAGTLAGYGNCLPNVSSYAYPIATGGTCYSGYGGIYPQATPLQQVALALKQAPTSTTSLTATVSHSNSLLKTTSSSSADSEKRQHQRRKFQELPVASKGLNQVNSVPLLPARILYLCWKTEGKWDIIVALLSIVNPCDLYELLTENWTVIRLRLVEHRDGTKSAVFGVLWILFCFATLWMICVSYMRYQIALLGCVLAFLQNSRQGSECFKSGLEDATGRSFSTLSPPKKLIQPRSSELPLRSMMPPPPPKFQSPNDSHDHVATLMLPPPLKFSSPKFALEPQNQNPQRVAAAEAPIPTVTPPASDTLLKLVDYGEEEDDDAAVSTEDSCRNNLMRSNESKPFWAV